jgi:hypothetical protein
MITKPQLEGDGWSETACPGVATARVVTRAIKWPLPAEHGAEAVDR